MRPRLLAAGGVLVVAGLAALGLNTPDRAAAAGKPKNPARLLVVGDEFTLVTSRSRLRKGPLVVQLRNGGEDVHDLKIRRRNGKRTRSIPLTDPGAVGELETFLKPGRYRLWCSVADHRQLGMRATIVVSKPRRR